MALAVTLSLVVKKLLGMTSTLYGLTNCNVTHL